MRLLKKLFGCKSVNASQDKNPVDSHENALIAVVTNVLETSPEHFSAKWSTNRYLNNSVQSKDEKILIMISDGQILQPIQPKMSAKQKDAIKALLAPIVRRDSDFLITKLISELSIK